MTPKMIMHRWSAFLQSLLLQTALPHVKALAVFSFAAARARHCHLSRVAALAPLSVQTPSTLRRLKRLLDNSHLDVEACCNEMAAWLGRWNTPGARLVLLLDETPHQNNWRVMKISVAYRKRALPLVWRTDALAGRAHKARVQQVLEQAAALIQRFCPNAQVVLLADRGLCWPDTMRFCQKQGWNYVLRVQCKTRLQNAQVTSCGPKLQGHTAHREVGACVESLVLEPGQWWCGRAQAFAKAGWLPVSVVGCWRAGAKEAWIVVSNLPPSLHLIRWYARRMWHEQAFRDEKSHGFCWGASRLRTAQRVHRLLLILALAALWLMVLGTHARYGAYQRELGLHQPNQRRQWSLFRAGWHLLTRCLDLGQLPPCNLTFSLP